MSDGAGLDVSKGSTVYSSTKTDGLPNPAPTSGLDVSPNLWLGAWDLIKPIWVPFISTFTFSKTEKVPEELPAFPQIPTFGSGGNNNSSITQEIKSDITKKSNEPKVPTDNWNKFLLFLYLY